jgi:hypothetical protein
MCRLDVRLNLTVPNAAAETDPQTMKTAKMLEAGNSGITQTLDEVIFIVWVLLV